ncbi:MAG: hypothetical protein MJB57_06930 [Gemmatimonadetes bacterium]|nr:hypothetical protein [Gemmatimonadota bacterium]
MLQRPSRTSATPRRVVGDGLRALACATVIGACGETTGPGESDGDADEPRSIVFASDRDGDLDLYLMRPDGSQVLQITDTPGSDFTPRWSPNGNRIAFASDRGVGGTAIYVMNANGTGVTSLGPGTYPAWSSSGASIAFYDAGRVWVMTATGTNRREVASTPNVNGIDWEPGGERILFGYADPLFVGFEVETDVVNADGTGRERFFRFGSRPAWSPDGTRVVVWRFSGMFQLDDIAVFPIGGDAVPIETSTENSPPRWSADGTRVLVTKGWLTDGVANEEIFAVPASGGSPVQLTNHVANDRDPDWRR